MQLLRRKEGSQRSKKSLEIDAWDVEGADTLWFRAGGEWFGLSSESDEEDRELLSIIHSWYAAGIRQRDARRYKL